MKGLAGEDHLSWRKGSWGSEEGTGRNVESCRVSMRRSRRRRLPGRQKCDPVERVMGVGKRNRWGVDDTVRNCRAYTINRRPVQRGGQEEIT